MKCEYLQETTQPTCSAGHGQPGLTSMLTVMFCLAGKHQECPRYRQTKGNATPRSRKVSGISILT